MLVQNSYEKISKWIFRLWNGRLPKPYELNANVEWKALKGESRISISGRAVGGCLDSNKFCWYKI